MDQESFETKCRENGLKLTPQRLAIFQELAGSRDHPSTDRVFQKIRKKFPRISFDTVNRTLLTFSDMGLIRVVEGCAGGRCFDTNTSPHHHLRCIKCHAIIDFYNKTYDEMQIPEELPAKFKVLGKKVVLEGLCEKCG
ncbi:MAG: transcriptional repressor [Candidatus Omnitrophica bacterium]|nr:transcriptional repressor [Candidatus Omnitrophota bacterium]